MWCILIIISILTKVSCIERDAPNSFLQSVSSEAKHQQDSSSLNIYNWGNITVNLVGQGNSDISFLSPRRGNINLFNHGNIALNFLHREKEKLDKPAVDRFPNFFATSDSAAIGSSGDIQEGGSGHIQEVGSGQFNFDNDPGTTKSMSLGLTRINQHQRMPPSWTQPIQSSVPTRVPESNSTRKSDVSGATESTNIETLLQCDFYDASCENATCATVEQCGEKTSAHCFAAWSLSSGKLFSKGCLHLSRHNCSDQNCVSRTNNDHQFCCCMGKNNCNRNFSVAEDFKEFRITTNETSPFNSDLIEHVHDVHSCTQWLLIYCLLPALFVCALQTSLLYYCRRRFLATRASHLVDKEKALEEGLSSSSSIPSELTSSPPTSSSSSSSLAPIMVVSRLSSTGSSSVWRGEMGFDGASRGRQVAIKIQAPSGRRLWKNECEIYQAINGIHDNILHFVGAERRLDQWIVEKTELWLVVDYHERGSLRDYLGQSTLTWQSLLEMGLGILSGLQFMHDYPVTKRCIIDTGSEESEDRRSRKSAIVHRDLKSANILLKSDLSPCISDFGLALQIGPSGVVKDDVALEKVGTCRYMAPELLQGAVRAKRSSLTAIDMYACSLVLWEMISRCSTPDSDVGDYRLPYEDEIGQHPTMEEMTDVVVRKKLRPNFAERCFSHSGLRIICADIEECWDDEPEMRLSANGLLQRFSAIEKLSFPST